MSVQSTNVVLHELDQKRTSGSVKGLASDKPNGKNTQKAAYLAAGYSPTTEPAAEAAASRLLRKVKPILERVRELQAQALARLDPRAPRKILLAKSLRI